MAEYSIVILQKLHLGNCNIAVEACNDLALSIKCNQHLQGFHLENNCLQSSAIIILQALSKLSSLIDLDLQGNLFNEDAGEYLTCMIINNTGLVYIIV